jgi:hypothetical protein
MVLLLSLFIQWQDTIHSTSECTRAIEVDPTLHSVEWSSSSEGEKLSKESEVQDEFSDSNEIDSTRVIDKF